MTQPITSGPYPGEAGGGYGGDGCAGQGPLYKDDAPNWSSQRTDLADSAGPALVDTTQTGVTPSGQSIGQKPLFADGYGQATKPIANNVWPGQMPQSGGSNSGPRSG